MELLVTGPHNGAVVHSVGDVASATQAVVLLHGRGGSAEQILQLSQQFAAEDTVWLAPQASGHTWYPQRFIVPQADNQPHLSSALAVVSRVLSQLEERDFTKEQIVLAGFSQGACLVAEYLKQNPARYKGVCIWSGGLIGTDDEVHEEISGSLDQTPVYLGCDSADFHIPLERVQQTAEYFKIKEVDVQLDIYEQFGHQVHPNGLEVLARMIAS